MLESAAGVNARPGQDRWVYFTNRYGKGNPSESIGLSQIASVTQPFAGKPREFEVHEMGRVNRKFHLRAPSANEASEWVRVMQERMSMQPKR